jgi:hypothetical protein
VAVRLRDSGMQNGEVCARSCVFLHDSMMQIYIPRVMWEEEDDELAKVD